MNRKFRLILCALLALCMMFTVLPLAVFAEGEGTTPAEEEPAQKPVAKDYDTAKDGDLLYTVDFSGTDGVYTNPTQTDGNATIVFDGVNNNRVLFTNKSAGGASLYTGDLPMYRLTGRIYTVSYYVENTNVYNIRAGGQFLYDGTIRMGITNCQTNTSLAVPTDALRDMTLLPNGSTGVMIGKKVTRLIDSDSRQYFKMVVDGTHSTVRYYTLSAENVWEILYETHLSIETTKNYLVAAFYSYDVLTISGIKNHVALGNVQITKGDEFAKTEKTAYEQKYDALNDGDTIYNVDFRANNEDGFVWGSYRPNINMSADAVSDDGTTLNYTWTAGAAQCYSSYFPDAEIATYGNYTIEFFVKSDLRTGLNLFAHMHTSSNNEKESTYYHGIGFSYFNPDSGSVNMFVMGATWATKDSNNYKRNTSSTVGNGYYDSRSIGTVYSQQQNPDTTDESKPNVKIEVNVLECTATNYILVAGKWVKTASIHYGSSDYLPVIYPHAYNANTNATFKNMKVVKGLSISKEGKTYVDFKLDGEYTSAKLTTVTASTKLPTPVAKPYYISHLETKDGLKVETIADLELNPGYNLVELVTVYEPVPEPDGIELRGVQTSTNPGTTTTSVRFVAAIDGLNYSAAGFLITATWKDAEGNVHVGKNVVDKSTTVVYQAILANTADGCKAITATEMGVKYIVAIAIDDVPLGKDVQVDFVVTPYVVELGSTEYTRGEATTVTFVNGQYVENATPIEIPEVPAPETPDENA